MISVCMPYWQRQAALDRALASYRKFYSGLEFSIADDGSNPPVHAPGCKVSYLPRKNRPLNPCVPINAAVNASSGDVIVLTNPEIEHVEPVLDEMLAMLEPMTYVAARCRDADGQWLAGPEVDYSTSGRLPVPKGAHFHFCAMFHREAWDLSGGFDESYRFLQACDDNDFLWRLHSKGVKFKTAEGMVLHHRSHTQWNLPHAREHFRKLWPNAA